MRKLSKKISMLMVLAMLVSLFSGIVSASAASAWSFKSSKYDVEVGETIEMEKNEYADFDLFKNDAAPEGYTVKWSSSDPDAVWVNAKTGQLRADKFKTADYGDKATISATFTNTATGKSATRSFVIVVAEAADYEIAVNFGDEVLAVGQKYDLAAVVKADGKEVEAKVEFAIDGKAIDAAYTPAAEGEFTIVTTATIDGKVVAEVETAVVVVEAGLESAKQISFNTVALTFGSADAAKAVAADASKLNAVWLAGENEITAFVKSLKVDEQNANVVNVELYNNLSKDVTYKFTYAEKSAEVKGVDLSKFDSIKIATQSVAANTYAEIKVNFFNGDVLVATKNDGFTLSADYSIDFFAAGTQVYVYGAGKAATITAKVDMGYDTTTGVKNADLTDTATLVSYDANAITVSDILGWAVVADGADYASTTYGANGATLAVNEGAKKLYFKFTVTDISGTVTPCYNDGATNGKYSYFEYATTNDSVLLVDVLTGKLYPVASGTAQVIVTGVDANNNKTVIGVFNVTVIDTKLLTSIAPTFSKNKLSAGSGEIIKLKPAAKDQFGAAITPEYYNIKLLTEVADVTIEAKQGDIWTEVTTTDKGFWCTANDWDGAPYIEFKATAAAADAKGVLVSITAKQGNIEINRVLNLSVKTPGDATKYGLDSLTPSFDVNMTAKPSDKTERWFYETAVRLNAYDKDDYYVGEVAIGNGVDNAVNDMYFEVMKDGKVLTGGENDPVKWNEFDQNGPCNTFYAMDGIADLDDSDGLLSEMKPIKTGTGTYTVIAYKIDAGSGKGRPVAQKNITVTDSSTPITVIQKENKISKSAFVVSGAVVEAKLYEELASKLTFKRDGKDIELAIESINYTMTDDMKRLYITDIKAREIFEGFVVIYNVGDESAYLVRELKGIGKVFEIVD